MTVWLWPSMKRSMPSTSAQIWSEVMLELGSTPMCPSATMQSTSSPCRTSIIWREASTGSVMVMSSRYPGMTRSRVSGVQSPKTPSL